MLVLSRTRSHLDPSNLGSLLLFLHKCQSEMDRFAWTDGLLYPEEQLVHQQNGVRLYDGDNKTSYDQGKLLLTTHRLIWRDHRDQQCILSLLLKLVVFIEEQAATFTKSAKIIVHLSPSPSDKPTGPVTHSSFSFVKLSFKEGGQREFQRCFQEELEHKRWEIPIASATSTAHTNPGNQRKVRAGIVGIERNLKQKLQQTDKNISEAFEDLNQLMDKAKEMVTLSKNITTKIKEKQGDITEDETIKFKSYLLSLGIPDPVTRETHGSGDKYYKELAKQISSMMERHLEECGGLMTLSDVYCRVNRARGMELLSPDDLLNACKQLATLKLPVRFNIFESGVMVLQLHSHNEQEMIKKTTALVTEQQALTAEELSKFVGVSVILSKERLLSAEHVGMLCRDETVEGLRFYPNLFLTEPVT